MATTKAGRITHLQTNFETLTAAPRGYLTENVPRCLHHNACKPALNLSSEPTNQRQQLVIRVQKQAPDEAGPFPPTRRLSQRQRSAAQAVGCPSGHSNGLGGPGPITTSQPRTTQNTRLCKRARTRQRNRLWPIVGSPLFGARPIASTAGRLCTKQNVPVGSGWLA